MSYRALMFVAAIVVAAPLAAQDGAVVIDPGMTRAEVVDRLGKPLNERKSGEHTYLFYRNGCEKTCGMNDLVVLDDGKVTDAIFRSPGRRYSGTSSSPVGVKPGRSKSAQGGDSGVAVVRRAKRGGIVIARPAKDSTPATVTGVEVVPGSAPVLGTSAARNADADTKRAVLPVPLPGAKVNPADSVRALTPDRPTPLPGTKLNPADSIRAEQIRRQQADSTRKP